MFRPYGAVPYDARLMSWNRDARIVSLWTPTGRVTVPYTGRPEDLCAARRGAPLVTYAEDLPIVRRYWRHVFGKQLATPAAVTVPNLYAVLSAVTAGAGYSVLPARCARSTWPRAGSCGSATGSGRLPGPGARG
ncbi:hypothetical protein [Nonomuraea sp. B19D2]|uniref:hypothetical protein n=1 Tax=Nonomuraea sp. B19D2 TaxID=3159561 RepID=UPI0032DB65A3